MYKFYNRRIIISNKTQFIVSRQGLSSFWLLFPLPLADEIISLEMQHFIHWNIRAHVFQIAGAASCYLSAVSVPCGAAL